MSDQPSNEKLQPKLVSLSERRQQGAESELKRKLDNLSKGWSDVMNLNPEQVVLSYTYRDDEDNLIYESMHWGRDAPLDWDVFGLLEAQRSFLTDYITNGEYEDE